MSIPHSIDERSFHLATEQMTPVIEFDDEDIESLVNDELDEVENIADDQSVDTESVAEDEEQVAFVDEPIELDPFEDSEEPTNVTRGYELIAEEGVLDLVLGDGISLRALESDPTVAEETASQIGPLIEALARGESFTVHSRAEFLDTDTELAYLDTVYYRDEEGTIISEYTVRMEAVTLEEEVEDSSELIDEETADIEPVHAIPTPTETVSQESLADLVLDLEAFGWSPTEPFVQTERIAPRLANEVAPTELQESESSDQEHVIEPVIELSSALEITSSEPSPKPNEPTAVEATANNASQAISETEIIEVVVTDFETEGILFETNRIPAEVVPTIEVDTKPVLRNENKKLIDRPIIFQAPAAVTIHEEPTPKSIDTISTFEEIKTIDKEISVVAINQNVTNEREGEAAIVSPSTKPEILTASISEQKTNDSVTTKPDQKPSQPIDNLPQPNHKEPSKLPIHPPKQTAEQNRPVSDRQHETNSKVYEQQKSEANMVVAREQRETIHTEVQEVSTQTQTETTTESAQQNSRQRETIATPAQIAEFIESIQGFGGVFGERNTQAIPDQQEFQAEAIETESTVADASRQQSADQQRTQSIRSRSGNRSTSRRNTNVASL